MLPWKVSIACSEIMNITIQLESMWALTETSQYPDICSVLTIQYLFCSRTTHDFPEATHYTTVPWAHDTAPSCFILPVPAPGQPDCINSRLPAVSQNLNAVLLLDAFDTVLS